MISTSPMAGMHQPDVPEPPTRILGQDELRKLIAACERNKGFEGLRDTAMIRLFADCGGRLSEIAGLTLSDLELDEEVVGIVGSGHRRRTVPIGARTCNSLHKYLRVRERHYAAKLPDLSLGRKGSMTSTGIAQMIERRGRQAGLGHVHPHQLRHSFAHDWLSHGGQESDLMLLAGLRDQAKLRRYGTLAPDERARAAHRRLSLGERL